MYFCAYYEWVSIPNCSNGIHLFEKVNKNNPLQSKSGICTQHAWKTFCRWSVYYRLTRKWNMPAVHNMDKLWHIHITRTKQFYRHMRYLFIIYDCTIKQLKYEQHFHLRSILAITGTSVLASPHLPCMNARRYCLYEAKGFKTATAVYVIIKAKTITKF